MDWRKIRRDLSWATGYQFAAKLTGYVVLLILIRYLDQDRMGEFFFATALASFVASVSQLGTNQHLVRSASARPQSALDLLSLVVTLRLPFIVLAFLAINAFALYFKSEIASTILLASIFVLLRDSYYSFAAFFVGLRRVGYRLATSLLGDVVLLAGVATLVALRVGLNAILWCYVVAHALPLLAALLVIRARFGRLRVRWDPAAAREILRQSTPLFLLTVLGLFHFKVDVLMLGFLKPVSAVAVYESAYKFLEVSRSLVWPGVVIFFPVCSALAARREWRALSGLSRRLLLSAAALACVLMIVVLSSGHWVIPFMFGESYVESVPVLRILFLAAPALFIALVTTYLASSIGAERPVVMVLLASLVLNVGLNGVFIPAWGAAGAAWTTFISETFLAGASLWVVAFAIRRRSRAATPTERISPAWTGEQMLADEDL